MKKEVAKMLSIGIAALLFGCGRGAKEAAVAPGDKVVKRTSAVSRRQRDGLEKLTVAFGMMQQSRGVKPPDVELIGHRELRALLPERLLWMRRKDVSSELTSSAGVGLSSATAIYEGRRGTSVSVQIVDLASLSGVTTLAQMPWLDTEIYDESESGYSRTAAFSGFKGYEEYDTGSETCSIQVVPNKRLLVEMESRKLSVDEARSAMEELPLERLAALPR